MLKVRAKILTGPPSRDSWLEAQKYARRVRVLELVKEDGGIYSRFRNRYFTDEEEEDEDENDDSDSEGDGAQDEVEDGDDDGLPENEGDVLGNVAGPDPSGEAEGVDDGLFDESGSAGAGAEADDVVQKSVGLSRENMRHLLPCAGGEPLFPRLRTLDCTESCSPAFLLDLPSLFAPSLREVILSLRLMQEEENFALYEHLPTACPDLKRLSIYTDGPCDIEQSNALRDMILRFNSLTTLGLPDTRVPALAHLSQCDALESLELTLRITSRWMKMSSPSSSQRPSNTSASMRTITFSSSNSYGKLPRRLSKWTPSTSFAKRRPQHADVMSERTHSNFLRRVWRRA